MKKTRKIGMDDVCADVMAVDEKITSLGEGIGANMAHLRYVEKELRSIKAAAWASLLLSLATAAFVVGVMIRYFLK